MNAEIEVLRVLHRAAKAMRRGERLELVDPARNYEVQFQQRIDEIEAEIARTETPELPLKQEHANAA
jgi:hypothetical protein